MALDIPGFATGLRPLGSDPSKTTAELDSWATNATERFLSSSNIPGMASALRSGLGAARSALSSGNDTTNSKAGSNPSIIEGQWLRKISLVVYGNPKVQVFGTIPPGAKAAGAAVDAAATPKITNVVNLFNPPSINTLVSPSQAASSVSNANTSGESKAPASTDGIDLSLMRINFRLKKMDKFEPNFLEARIYNLSPETIKKVRQYGRIQLAAGYEGENYGMIFDGTVIMYIVGKENPVDSYLDIKAADGDEVNNAAVGLTWASGSTPEQRTKDMLNAAGLAVGKIDMGEAGKVKSLRSTSFIGTLENGLRVHTDATRSSFFIEDGKAYVISWASYRRNEIVELSPTTGLVGIPKVTPNGIEAQCLLNPKLRLNTLVKIESGPREDGTYLLSDLPYYPGVEDVFTSGGGTGQIRAAGEVAPKFRYNTSRTNQKEGIYKILLLEHHGDTRGNPWYSSMICAAAGQDGKILDAANAGTAYSRTAAEMPQGQVTK